MKRKLAANIEIVTKISFIEEREKNDKNLSPRKLEQPRAVEKITLVLPEDEYLKRKKFALLVLNQGVKKAVESTKKNNTPAGDVDPNKDPE